MRTTRTRIIAGRVNGDGTPAAGGGEFTSRKTGTGVYSVQLPADFRLQGFSAVNQTADGAVLSSSPASANVLDIRTFSGGALDRAFTFVAVGAT